MNLKNKYIEFCNKLFFKYFLKRKDKFEKIKKNYVSARIKLLFESYLSIMYTTSILVFILSFIFSFLVLHFMLNLISSFLVSLAISSLSSLITFLIFYVYPKYKASELKYSIDSNLPFALLYLYVLAQSGIQPQKMFEILSKKEEFGGVSKECKNLVYQIKILGTDFITALINLSRTTPSEKFKSFLYSFIQTIKSEGNLKDFLYVYSRNLILEYKLKLKEYDEKLSLLLTAYTAMFVAFPLIIVIMIVIFSVLIQSLETINILKMGLLTILPVAHIIFLYLIQIMRPQT